MELWGAALLDAEGLSNDEMHLFDVPLVTPHLFGRYWAPRHGVDSGQLALDETELHQVNKGVGSKHRIAIASIVGRQPEIAEAAFAALVRHELEHARQWKACGDEPFELCEVAFMVYARRKAGRTTLPRGFRNHLPVEDDANAAASVFVRCERPASVAGLLDDKNFGPLARAQTRPEPPETLLARMVEFLLKYRATLAAMAETHPGDDTIEGFLRMANAPNAARIWQSLTAV